MPKGESAVYQGDSGWMQATATEKGVFLHMIGKTGLILSPEKAEQFGCELIRLAEWSRILQETRGQK